MSGKAPAADMPCFSFPVRVYYEDTDSGGVVYYANYLKFMERARTEWLREKGFEQTALLDEYRVIFVVRSVAIEYLRPARFDDLLDVTVRQADLGRSQIRVRQTVVRQRQAGADELLAQADVKIVCVDSDSFRPTRIPQAVGAALAGTGNLDSK